MEKSKYEKFEEYMEGKDIEKFDDDQKKYIYLGFCKGFSSELIDIYAKPENDWLQMQWILAGFENFTDLSSYDVHGFDDYQKHEIWEGVYDGVDISKYAKPEISWEKMREIRGALEKNFDLNNNFGRPKRAPEREERSSEDFFKKLEEKYPKK